MARRPKTVGKEARKVLAMYDGLSAQEQYDVRQTLRRREARSRTTPKTAPPPPPRPSAPLSEIDSPSDQLLAYLGDVSRSLRQYIPTDNYQPGDENRLDLGRDEVRRAIEPLEWMLKTYFRYEVDGIENVPRKGAGILVSNHGLLPVDGWFLGYEIARHTGRWIRGLTDWRIYRIPYLRQVFMDMGVVLGSHENGDALLEREELLFIMPGGSKEAWKSSRYRYRLLWRGRYGFIRLALRNQCPIIPAANVGTDDTYFVLFDGYTTSYQIFRSRKTFLPISLPVGLGLLPFPVKLMQYVGEPIYFDHPPEAEHDIEIVKECQALVKSKVYELIDRGLREREERKMDRYAARNGAGPEKTASEPPRARRRRSK